MSSAKHLHLECNTKKSSYTQHHKTVHRLKKL